MNTAFDNERASALLQWLYKNAHFMQLQHDGMTYDITCNQAWNYEDWLRILVPKHLREHGCPQWVWHYFYDRIKRIEHNITWRTTDNYWPQQSPSKYAGLDLAQYIEQRMQEAEVKEQQ